MSEAGKKNTTFILNANWTYNTSIRIFTLTYTHTYIFKPMLYNSIVYFSVSNAMWSVQRKERFGTSQYLRRNDSNLRQNFIKRKKKQNEVIDKILDLFWFGLLFLSPIRLPSKSKTKWAITFGAYAHLLLLLQRINFKTYDTDHKCKCEQQILFAHKPAMHTYI